jgi:dephospho-CoA kinase
VFGSDGAAAADEERSFLESLIHPRVRRDLERQMAALAKAGTGVVILDVPLLVEVGWESMCDHVYFVDAPEAARAERASTRGWSEAELRRREAAQAPLDQKRRSARSILQNSGDLEDLRRQVAAAYQDWMRTSVPRPSK